MIGGVLISGSSRSTSAAVPGTRLIEPPGWSNLLLAFAAFALILFGVKLLLIHVFGNDTPYWDQWDAEAALLYEPYVRGDLPWRNLFAGHNEHRILTTRLLGLALLQINGLWSPLLEMVVNAALHILALCVTIGLLGKAVGRAIVPPLLAFGAIVFSVPYALENTLAGFQAQFYFVLLFSVISIWLLVTREAFGKGWWGGVAFALVAYFSFASGIFALAAAAVTLLVRWLLVDRHRREWLAAVLLLFFFALGVWATPIIPGHAVLKAANFQQLVHALTHVLAWPGGGGVVSIAWPSPRELFWVLVRNLPWLLLAWRMSRERTARTSPLWFVFALGIWLAGQAVSVAYGRAGDVLSSRYLDLHAIALLVNFGALLAGLATASARSKRAWAWGAFVWTAWVMLVLAQMSLTQLPTALNAKQSSSAVQEANVQSYLVTHDIAAFRTVPFLQLPYPTADRLAGLLDSPLLQTVLPRNLQTPLKPASLEPAQASGLQSGGAFPGTSACDCQSWGSYGPQGDHDVGDLRMNYQPIATPLGARDYTIKVAGYPSKAGRLELIQDGISQELKLARDPGEQWATLHFSVRPAPFTIRVIDNSDTSWLAVSQPSRAGWLDRALDMLLFHWAWFVALGVALICLLVRESTPGVPRSLVQPGSITNVPLR